MANARKRSNCHRGDAHNPVTVLDLPRHFCGDVSRFSWLRSGMLRTVSIAAAAEMMPALARISVAGVSGAGKSTLSQKLSKRHGLHYVSLDRDMRWLPRWQVRDRQQQRRLHDGFVLQDRWIIDGTNISFMDTRLPRSDLLI